MRIDVVAADDLADDRWEIIRHVSREHARLKEIRIIRRRLGLSLAVAHKPLGMRGERIAPIEIGTVAGNRAEAALLRSRVKFPEKISAIQILAVPMKWHLARIKGEDAGDADKHGADLRAGPIISPSLDIENRRIMFGEIGLADA